MAKSELESLREQVDSINQSLLKLLSLRGERVRRISTIKNAQSIELRDPRREHEELSHILKMNRGPYTGQEVMHLFRQIFSISLQLMERAKQEPG